MKKSSKSFKEKKCFQEVQILFETDSKIFHVLNFERFFCIEVAEAEIFHSLYKQVNRQDLVILLITSK